MLGIVLGIRMMAIYTKKSLPLGSWSSQHHWHYEGSASQEVRSGTPVFWYLIPAEIQLAFSSVMIRELQNLLSVSNMWLC